MEELEQVIRMIFAAGWRLCNIYIRVVRRAVNLLRASFSPIFQYFSAVNVSRVSFSPVFQYFVTYVHVCISYAMRHGIVLSAIDSSKSSAMDTSAIGVDGAVLVVCKDLAARYLIFGVSDSTETFLTVSYCSQISMHVSTSYSLCSAEHVNHCAGVAPARPQCSAFF